VLAKSIAANTPTTINTLLSEAYTKTELKIIRLLCEQKTIKEIALTLQTQSNSIDYSLQNILRRANCANVSALLVFAVENDLV
jgi:DNA-binding NarL/FixJ family response regulator